MIATYHGELFIKLQTGDTTIAINPISKESDKKVTANFVENHLRIGIDSLKQLINDGMTVKHLKF